MVVEYWCTKKTAFLNEFYECYFISGNVFKLESLGERKSLPRQAI